MRHKKKNRRWLFFCVFLAGLTIQTDLVHAQGTDAYDPERRGSLTVCLDDINTRREGVTLSCYQIAEAVTDRGYPEGFLATETFAGMDISISELQNPEVHRETADALEAFLKEHPKIAPVYREQTDASGCAEFPSLEQGIYLILQEDGHSVYGRIQPFLVGIPYMEDDQLLYEVETNTKGARPDVKLPGKEPSGSDTAKTDDPFHGEWLMLCMACAFTAIVLAANRRKRQKDNP